MQNGSPLCLVLLCLLDCLRRSGSLLPVGLIHATKPLDWVAHIFRMVTCLKLFYLIPPLPCTALHCSSCSTRTRWFYTPLSKKSPCRFLVCCLECWPLPRRERLLL
ncbi:uncharacterized protein LY79DRAFT_356589 [Colletotrichum navitas]|uniref:Secreted protein n=1 Tax=Colletotrichum navitas TaxID=681940 RepID=A0AAD8QB78_9PEZI|nr:uncharacterized protein LY79DRAFT_356589 [Colletotrichum navitas]KAK1597794.1 hypothetical protein LY79DRAFT_356589 [Colletotrichum navitas]